MSTKGNKARPSMGSQRRTVAYQFSLVDLFDSSGRLRRFEDLPPEIAAEIASFEIVRITMRTEGETITTEELIRVKTRDRRTAEIARRGGGSISERVIRIKPLRPGLVTSRERPGAGRTAAAEATQGDCAVVRDGNE
jgi:hypothetical protein